MQPEEGYAEPMLKVEATEVIAGPEHIGQRQDRMLPPFSMIDDGTLTDAQGTGSLLFVNHGTDSFDAGSCGVALLV
jgi:hypothetical protein